ncbi:MAG: hypothetical protein ACOCZS_03365 [Verrucomicrobiota bacterium]
MRITEEHLNNLLENRELENITADTVYDSVRNDSGIGNFLPDGFARVDPRDGAVVLYNSARAKRPHKYGNAEEDNKSGEEVSDDQKDCPVCAGKTTGIIDIADLSDGYTFINKNLFPLLDPRGDKSWAEPTESFYSHSSGTTASARGVHLLQWTSSVHDRDWHNMPPDDCFTVMKRLAVLEKTLLVNDNNNCPVTGKTAKGIATHGYVSIIKNFGQLVGGSLPHGHQQIAHSNIMPRRFRDNMQFETQHKQNFSEFLQQHASENLIVKEYNTALILVPPFIRRPFTSVLVLKDTTKAFLHELSETELQDVTRAWRDMTATLLSLMPAVGREPAYNITVSNGPGAGLYFDFLPYTQETGGYEHLGLWICQSTPELSAEGLRNHINGTKNN